MSLPTMNIVDKKNDENVIEIDGVTKTYQLYARPIDRLKEAIHPFHKIYHRNFNALTNVSLSIKKGDCIGFIGLNGSGKSTLLQLIAKVIVPTQGTIKARGKIAALLELGAGFNPEFSGIENARFQCALQGINAREFKTLLPKIEEFAGIGDFINQPVKTYSSGMYVRLAFSTAINISPDILIVDEALAVGDMVFQTKCLAKIREFRDEGKTMLFVSHDAAAVKSMCNYSYLLHKGEVIDHGDPEPIFNHYNSLISSTSVKDGSHYSDLRTRSGNGRIRINSVRIKNSDGLYSDTVTSGTEVTLEIPFTAYDDLDDVTIGFSIHDRMGIEVFGINNHNMKYYFPQVKKGHQYLVSYNFKMELGSHIFTISVSAHPSDNHVEECYDWINRALIFRVVPDPGSHFVGLCHLKTQCQFVELSS